MLFLPLFPRPVRLWLLALVPALLSCEKEPLDQLPAATQKGQNTAGFLVDGKAWLPKGNYIMGVYEPVNGSWKRTAAGPSLNISMSYKTRDTRSGVGIHLMGVRQPGNYTLSQAAQVNLGNAAGSYATYHKEYVSYYTDPPAGGSVTITRLDTVKHIASGTFELLLLEDGGTRTVQITQGRFDVRLSE